MKKFLCIILSLTAIVYSLIYGSLGGFSGNDGALSKIGLSHPVMFVIWGALTCGALFFNIALGFMKTKYKFYIILLAIAFVGMVLTVSCDFDYSKHTEYLLHCIGSLGFSIFTGVTVFLLFLLKRNYIFTAITAVILISDTILLIIFKETALIELAPIIAGLIMLTVHNLGKERTAVEIK